MALVRAFPECDGRRSAQSTDEDVSADCEGSQAQERWRTCSCRTKQRQQFALSDVV